MAHNSPRLVNDRNDDLHSEFNWHVGLDKGKSQERFPCQLRTYCPPINSVPDSSDIIPMTVTTPVAVLAIGFWIFSFKLFFKDFGDFIECLRYIYQPGFISFFRGETSEDFWATTKVHVWLGLGAILGYCGGDQAKELFLRFWNAF
jgi:hypothetical protein